MISQRSEPKWFLQERRSDQDCRQKPPMTSAWQQAHPSPLALSTLMQAALGQLAQRVAAELK
jgi:hypothetical protein